MQDEEKRKRIIAAVTVSAVILIVILLIVVVYQIVEICAINSRRDALEREYQQILADIEESEDWMEKYELNEDAILYMLALQNGYRPQ